MEIITSSLKNIESLFSNYPFAQDFIIACSGVIFGGMVTVLINKGAIRKQAYFDLQYKILTELIEQVFDLEKSIEYVEIGLSFGDAKIKPFENEINALEHKALTLNEVFREKRSIVHKHLTGVMLEKSAHIPAKLYGVIYDNEKSLLSNPIKKESVSIADIAVLRNLTVDARELKNEMTSSLEKLIFPSVLFKLKRGMKKGKVFCGNIYGIWRVQRTERKKQKKVNKWQN